MITHTEKEQIRNRTAKPLLSLAIISICMVFAGLTSAYVVRSGDKDWLLFELPFIFTVSTIFILLSSGTMYWALQSAKKDNQQGVLYGMMATLTLGLLFAVTQFMGWGDLTKMGVFIGGKGSNPAGSFIYVISGIHLVHMLGGLIMLIYVCIKSAKKAYHSKNLLGLQLCSTYWHFLDLLWIYLFVFFKLAN